MSNWLALRNWLFGYYRAQPLLARAWIPALVEPVAGRLLRLICLFRAWVGLDLGDALNRNRLGNVFSARSSPSSSSSPAAASGSSVMSISTTNFGQCKAQIKDIVLNSGDVVQILFVFHVDLGLLVEGVPFQLGICAALYAWPLDDDLRRRSRRRIRLQEGAGFLWSGEFAVDQLQENLSAQSPRKKAVRL